MKKLLIVSAAPLIEKDGIYSAYSPYAKEMAMWANISDEIYFCCPIWKEDRNLLNSIIGFKINKLFQMEEFSVKNSFEILKSFKSVFFNLFIIFKAFRNADHIHLRCPGNISLLGCLIQILFPSKKKTAKYAGNWDPNSEQPLSYKVQKWILSNTFLTRNMTVLVYGDWSDQTKNIKSFFTASYYERDKVDFLPKDLSGDIKFLFVGTLSAGKDPLYAVRLVHELLKAGRTVQLDLYGEGLERSAIEKYIDQNKLRNCITLKGNCDETQIRIAYENSHFLILASKSEGWPKVVSEAMFWGTVPVVSAISCVPFMLYYGRRGIILDLELESDLSKISQLLDCHEKYREMSNLATLWSRKYTIDKFESEIKLLLN